MSKSHARLIASNNLKWSLNRRVARGKRAAEEVAEIGRLYDKLWEAAKIPRHLMGRG